MPVDFGDTSAGQLALVEEVTPNVDPGTAADAIPFRSENLTQSTTDEMDDSHRPDYQTEDYAVTGFSYAGSIDHVVRAQAFDVFYEGSLRSSFAGTQTVTDVTIAFVTAGNQITDSNSGFASFAADDVIFVSGSASNDGAFVVSSAAAGALDILYPVVTDESAGASITVEHDGQLKMGTDVKSYTIYKESTDLELFWAYHGCQFGGFTVGFPTQGRLTGTVDVRGMSEETDTSSLAASINAAPATNMMVAPKHLSLAFSGLAAADVRPLNGTLTVTRELRDQRAANAIDPLGIGQDRWQVTLEGGIWFKNFDLYKRTRNETLTDALLAAIDANGKGIAFRMPECRMTNSQVVYGGGPGDVVIETTLKSRRSATLSSMIQLGRSI